MLQSIQGARGARAAMMFMGHTGHCGRESWHLSFPRSPLHFSLLFHSHPHLSPQLCTPGPSCVPWQGAAEH